MCGAHALSQEVVKCPQRPPAACAQSSWCGNKPKPPSLLFFFFLFFLLQVYFISYPKPHQVGFTDDRADCSPGNPRDILTISLLICPHLVHHQVLLILLPKHLWTPSIATITTLVQIPSASLLPAMLATFNPFLVLLESFVSSENHIRPPL